MNDQTIMKTENNKTAIGEKIHHRRFTAGGLSDAIFGLSEAGLLINATINCPTAIIPAAIIVALGWSIVIAVRMWPNDQS
jgi:hypothetical protein